MKIAKSIKISFATLIIILLVAAFFFFVYPSIIKSQHSDELPIVAVLNKDYIDSYFKDTKTDVRIYLPSFPHYSKQYEDFDESREQKSFADSFSSEQAKEKSDTAYKEYETSVGNQVEDVVDWENTIEDGESNADTLTQLVNLDSHHDSLQTILKDYAEAATNYWKLEDQYYWSEYCYRTQELLNIEYCQGKIADDHSIPDDIEQKLSSAKSVMAIMINRYSEYIK